MGCRDDSALLGCGTDTTTASITSRVATTSPGQCTRSRRSPHLTRRSRPCRRCRWYLSSERLAACRLVTPPLRLAATPRHLP
ncbi:hypothetical protein RRG08_030720 [Elysia crispata]|uniref:Uncharacterized protein n=1 Tax=Elysia crispata TaxID=231223 RepID=A0AAE1CSI5_9GAST|nr:hypothetical protein RRG08_030720 [Elysia crispata]